VTEKQNGKSGAREWKIFAWVAFVVVVALFAAFTFRESRKRIVAKPLFTPLAPSEPDAAVETPAKNETRKK